MGKNNCQKKIEFGDLPEDDEASEVCFRKEQALEDAAKLSEAASDDPKFASASAEPLGVSPLFNKCEANPLRKAGLT